MKLPAIIHIVNNHSGAAKYSSELLSQCAYSIDINIIFVYLSDITKHEIELFNFNNCHIFHFPEFVLLPDKNSEYNLIKVLLGILSLYLPISEKLIVHGNGLNLSKSFAYPKRNLKYLYTLHFLSTKQKPSEIQLYNHIICVTQYAKNYIDREFNANTKLIYNGVREVVSTENRDRVRARYGFEEDECLVLYVGRIDESKGITFLAKLFSGMGLENARLVIVGSGAYDLVFEKIEANHSKITFLGNIDNQEVHNLMAVCDIGVIPSLNEQCSYVALEMMSHGMAIIASEVRGMGELFVCKDIALTVPVDYTDDIPTLDTDVLKQHIITLAGDVGLRKRLGANARREWAEHYTAERMARETFEVYKELAAQF